MFPQNWEVSERITVQFCHNTREELTKIMAKRKHEIDVKLLLYAIQKTASFEQLLARRFTGATLVENADASKIDLDDLQKSPFLGLIGKCFIPHLKIYIDNIDKNLADLIERFLQDEKQNISSDIIDIQVTVLPSCSDLFMFYKKSMIQCHQLDRCHSMLDLTKTFQKYLREYAFKILMNSLPKIEAQSLVGVQTFRDIPKMSSGLIQNFSSLLKEGDLPKLTKEEQIKICCILTTGEYALETTQQLSEKLKEKIDPNLADQIDLTQEQDNFHGQVENNFQINFKYLIHCFTCRVISNCIQLLVQDLENACEPALTTMSKVKLNKMFKVQRN